MSHDPKIPTQAAERGRHNRWTWTFTDIAGEGRARRTFGTVAGGE